MADLDAHQVALFPNKRSKNLFCILTVLLGAESHAGQIFTCVGALSIGNRPLSTVTVSFRIVL